MNEYAIQIENLSAGYNAIPVIENITFELPPAKILAVMGPNGAGKTTLLKAILGLVRILRGSIKVLGYTVPEDLQKIRKLIGYVPQREYVSMNVPITVKDVVLSGIMLRKGPLTLPTKKDIILVREVLKHVNLPEETWFRKFNELSGGQQQKTLIARALVANPKILLLDEPFSATDVISRQEIMELLVNLKKRMRITIIIVLHDVNDIIEHIDYILLLNKRMIAFGDPLEVLTSENLKKAYGIDVKVIRYEEKCIALIGDKHA